MDEPRTNTERFTDSIREAGLLPLEETPHLEILKRDFVDPDGLAREMVNRRWLTEYQAEKLLEGSPSDLLLGPYVLIDLLGEGGMGRVYKARHRLMNRIVALKVIRADLLALGEARQRFLREIEAAARVWHPNLITALDAAPMGDSYVLVMEYAEGSNLSRLLQTKGVPPIRHACDWVRQAALGLHHAHEQGLIHRDVKPSNLLLTTRDQIVKVLDLGLARLGLPRSGGGDDDPITASGVVIGTPDYMSPEQALNPRGADPRSDVYSLGCTLYQLLTGRPPFPGGSFTQKLLWHQQNEPTDPTRLRASLPPEIPPILARMMAKSPGDRQATAAEVAEQLAPFCAAAGLKTLYHPLSPPISTDVGVTPTPGRPLPLVRHEPHDSTTYDVVEPLKASKEEPTSPETTPEEATVAPVEPTPNVLARPAVADTDDWWREERADDGERSAPRPRTAEVASQASRHVRRPKGIPLSWILGFLAVGLVLVAGLLHLLSQ